MKLDKKRLKKKYDEKYTKAKYYLSRSDIIFRASLTLLLTTIFVILFFAFGGNLYFTSVRAVSEFKGYPLQVHAINVGQGDCTLIKFPNNETMLIDAGRSGEGERVVAYLKNYFKNEGLNKINYLVLTHSDSDHIGGAIDVLQNIEVDTVYRPNIYTQEEADELTDGSQVYVVDTQTYNTIIDLIEQKDCNVVVSQAGESMNLGGARVEFLSPNEEYYSDSNSFSAVIMITYQTKKFLFMGDAGVDIENVLIEEYGSYLDADVLKVGHHGSATSSSDAFLEIVSPSYSLMYISSNKDFPDTSVVNKLRELGSKIYSTYSEGDFAMTVYNDNIIFADAPEPTFDIALLISIYVIIVLLTWGMKNPGFTIIKPRRVKQKTLKESD